MNVVAHQHVSVNPTTGLGGILLQPIKVKAVIFLRNKADLPVIAPLN